MKWLAALAALISLLAGALLLWWDAADGTRFSRTMQDLRDFSPERLAGEPVSDPWGGEYRTVELVSDGRSILHVFSVGPDGRTQSLGHDDDDIALWTDRANWIAALHPVAPAKLILGMSILTLVGAYSFHFGRTRRAKE